MPIKSVEVTYKGKQYCVVEFKKTYNKGSADEKTFNKLFVVNKEDFDEIMRKSDNWYQVSNYIGFVKINKTTNKNKAIYLHEFLMRDEISNTQNATTVDHINRNPMDNRRVNLRLASQTEQNFNQKKRNRTIVLPENCGIKKDDIPTGIWYCHATEKKGDLFVIEIKENNRKIVYKKSTSSRKISLKAKYYEVLLRMHDLVNSNPKIFNNKVLYSGVPDEILQSVEDFNRIIKKSGFEHRHENIYLMDTKSLQEIEYDYENDSHLTTIDKKYLSYMSLIMQNEKEIDKGSRRNIETLIELIIAKINPFTVPKYVQYTAKTDKRGSKFVISRNHPVLKKYNRSDWATTSDKNVSDKEKYKQVMTMMNELVKKNGVLPEFITSKKIQKKTVVNKNSGSKSSRKVSSLNNT